MKLAGSKSELENHLFTKHGPIACVSGEKIKVCTYMTEALRFFEECDRPPERPEEKPASFFWVVPWLGFVILVIWFLFL